MTIGNQIAYFRKQNSMTQEIFAGLLGVSNQAVSKWETNQCCPDIQLLPRIADIFEITMDQLFGREKTEKHEHVAEELPWEDDDTLRIVVYVGRTRKIYEDASRIQHLEFAYQGPALNVESEISVSCQRVEGSVTAGTSASCGDVGGDVTAGTSATCGTVSGNVKAGTSVKCGDVKGNVDAGVSVKCTSAGDIKVGHRTNSFF